MSKAHRDWACWALQLQGTLPALSASQWEMVVRHARRADLLARVAAQMEAAHRLDAVSLAPRAHFQAALLVCSAQQERVRAEALLIAAALRDLEIPVVLLKGAAYVVAGLPAARGRLFSDIDILVPRATLPEVESALRMAGWMQTHLDGYDQRYYRQWMHELPPMQHVKRGTTLDVHHNILPITVRHPPDATQLIANARRLPGNDNLWVLAPTDMLLHSMTHLFHNDDVSHALRDVSDMDLLLRHFSLEPGFWKALTDRARVLHLERPLAFGLWAASDLLRAPVPHEVLRQSARAAGLSSAMRWIWRRVLHTSDVDTAPRGTAAARFAQYVLAHWQRMPAPLLIRHLSIKAWKRAFAKSRSSVTDQKA